MKRLSERRLEQHLIHYFQRKSETSTRFQDARSFAEAGVLTTDRGLVLRLTNGQEFQITVVETTEH